MLGSSRYNIAQEPPAPPQENSTYEAKVVFRGINNQYYWYFGNYVAPPSINNSEDNTYYAIAWRQSSGTSTYFVDNKLNSVNIKQLNIPGKYLQVSNGPTKDNMYIDIFNNQTEPYYFKTSNNLGSYYVIISTTSCTLISSTEIAEDRAQTSPWGCNRCLVNNYLHNIMHS